MFKTMKENKGFTINSNWHRILLGDGAYKLSEKAKDFINLNECKIVFDKERYNLDFWTNPLETYLEVLRIS